ncbi:uncharacterized protein LOC128299596 [Anopheles moucheti]|uniref:uncharacterized protein LOC128299596 n=1 Tax=Anopheles moucheti TaxID=186751 RepID=UPI0022F126E1|nr:uncharacterized protein LOC128299596 [Anopheles moucheti]
MATRAIIYETVLLYGVGPDCVCVLAVRTTINATAACTTVASIVQVHPISPVPVPSNVFAMKLLWFVVFLLALVCAAFGQECPQGFDHQQGQCVTKRPVHGECPANSKYDLNKNLCVYT